MKGLICRALLAVAALTLVGVIASGQDTPGQGTVTNSSVKRALREAQSGKFLRNNGASTDPTWVDPIAGVSTPSLAQVQAIGSVADRQISWGTGGGAVTHLLGPTDQDFKISSAGAKDGIFNVPSSRTGRLQANTSDVFTWDGSTGTRSLSAHRIDGKLDARGAVYFPATSTSSTPYSVASTDYLILVNASGGAKTVTLPDLASNRSRVLVIKAISVAGGNVTIARSGSDTIDGATSLTISAQYGSFTLQAPDSGTDWAIE